MRSYLSFAVPALAALLVCGLWATPTEAAAADWAGARGPASGPARAYGSYANGCIAGAVALPPDGPGYQVMRLSRQRNYGHPELVDYLRDLGRAVSAAGLGGLLIGDLSQPRGGPMAFGHRSHQTGLDVDIWFRPAPADRLSASERETLKAYSVVAADGLGLEPALWSARQTAIVKTAAQDPRVERIFVNAAVKRALCRTAGEDRAWLRKVRAWWFHDDHFHVRLRCPADSPGCSDQEAPPVGDGCDADQLAWWLSKKMRALQAELRDRTSPAPPSDANLPRVCRQVLKAR